MTGAGKKCADEERAVAAISEEEKGIKKHLTSAEINNNS